MRFSEIVGLDETKQALIHTVNSNHIAHAQLFLGKEGYGNLALALAYATFVNCTNKKENDSCGMCPSCAKMDKLIHPDLHFVYPVSSTKSISGAQAISTSFVKNWREFVLENPYNTLPAWASFIGAENKQPNISKEESRHIVRNLSLRAFEAEYKTMLIWLPEYMHPAASNAILKILEEPPAKTLFLLVSNASDRLLTTILSRTQIVKVPAFSSEEIKKTLISWYNVEEERAGHAAYLANGNLNEALRLSNEVKNDSADAFKEWMRICFKMDFTTMVNWTDKFQRMGKEPQKSLLQYALNIFRESLAWKYGHEDLVRLETAELDFVKNFSKVLHENNLPELISLFNRAHFHVERNANPKIL
ncbi:MAG: ATP-binding protein, partial [Flammeovirgaceae bacterium]